MKKTVALVVGAVLVAIAYNILISLIPLAKNKSAHDYCRPTNHCTAPDCPFRDCNSDYILVK